MFLICSFYFNPTQQNQQRQQLAQQRQNQLLQQRQQLAQQRENQLLQQRQQHVGLQQQRQNQVSEGT